MNERDRDRRVEHEQHALGSSWLMFVLACVFLCAGAAGWSVFCGVVGLAWLASSNQER